MNIEGIAHMELNHVRLRSGSGIQFGTLQAVCNLPIALAKCSLLMTFAMCQGTLHDWTGFTTPSSKICTATTIWSFRTIGL